MHNTTSGCKCRMTLKDEYIILFSSLQSSTLPTKPRVPCSNSWNIFATTFQFKFFFSPILRHSLFSFLHKCLFPGVFAPANVVSDSKTYKHAHIYGYTHFLNTQTYKYDMSMFCCLSSPTSIFMYAECVLGNGE